MTAARDPKKQLERDRREAEKAVCAYCGKKVTMEDRCQDGLYLHRECAYASSQR
jgi:hypothetical protein